MTSTFDYIHDIVEPSIFCYFTVMIVEAKYRSLFESPYTQRIERESEIALLCERCIILLITHWLIISPSNALYSAV